MLYPDPIHSGAAAIALSTDGNPDGKGHNAFMLDWHRNTPRGVVAKPHRQLLSEFFTSMLILSATFKFRPAVGSPHYLYWIKGEWSLSLIAPEQWSQERRKAFAGTCVLQRDMTWTIAPSELLKKDNPVSDAMNRFYAAFARTLDSDAELDTMLPFYAANMPYVQRLHASALSRSVQASLSLGTQASPKCQHWYSLLPHQGKALLESNRS